MYFHSGDNQAWAAAEVDLSDWQKVPRFRIPQDHWQGIGWIRLSLDIDSTHYGKTLAMYLRLYGAADIYYNGRHIHSGGKVSTTLMGEQPVVERYPLPLIPDTPDSTWTDKKHVIAIRYSAQILLSEKYRRFRPYIYFQLSEHQNFIHRLTASWRSRTIQQTLLSAIFLVFAFLHLMLFVYSPKVYANLAFAFFSFSCASAVYTIYERHFSRSIDYDLFILLLSDSALLLLALAAVAFIHTMFYNTLKKRFYFYAGVVLLALWWIWFSPFYWPLIERLVQSLTLFALPEFFACWFSRKINRRQPIFDGGWIVGVGSLPMMGIGLHRLLELFGVNVPRYNLIELPLPFYGVLVMMMSMSVLLARNVAKTTRNLQEQLQNVKRLSDNAVQQEVEKARLEAENERKSQELESARELQLSMLPTVLPEHPDFDIAVQMETASEVGGDYYDLKMEGNTLTAVVGDATGHGLKAGTMVAATKSLFNSLRKESDLLDFLRSSSNALKQMGFSQMYMALAIFRLSERKLAITSAGMPFPLIYRAKEQRVEELSLKGMPLGSFPNFPYKKQFIDMNKDDVLVLLSDGLSERFNEKDEQLGDENISEVLVKHAARSAADILTALYKAGSLWGGKRALDDDCTIFVLKIR